MDIKVDAAVIFGLAETAENLLQEGGRPMRGSSQETGGKQGYAFFFHKGNLGKVNQKHFVGFVCGTGALWVIVLFVCLMFRIFVYCQ